MIHVRGIFDGMSEEPESDLERKKEWRLAGMIFFGLFAILLLYATFLILWPFMTAILLGAIVVILTFGIFKHVRARLKNSSTRAALVMLLGITLILVIPALILSILLVQQANIVVGKLQSGDAQAMVQRVNLTQHLQWIKRFAPGFDPATLSPQQLLWTERRRIEARRKALDPLQVLREVDPLHHRLRVA